MTVEAIEAAGVPIAARCDIVLSGDTPPAVCASMGLGLMKFGDVLQRLAPDLLVVLGDRYEALAAATAALICRVPIAHVHGGELSEGAIDDAMRHAITKMASLHFVASRSYRQRVIQLGESPERVFTVGAMACENVQRMTLLSRAELESSLSTGFARPLFLVTYHPATLLTESPGKAFAELLGALDQFPSASIFLTKANADTDGRIINGMIDEYAAHHPGRVHAAASLGQVRYMSLLREADVVIGNSSSGIIEAPLLGTPTVNIGNTLTRPASNAFDRRLRPRTPRRSQAPSARRCGWTAARHPPSRRGSLRNGRRRRAHPRRPRVRRHGNVAIQDVCRPRHIGCTFGAPRCPLDLIGQARRVHAR